MAEITLNRNQLLALLDICGDGDESTDVVIDTDLMVAWSAEYPSEGGVELAALLERGGEVKHADEP